MGTVDKALGLLEHFSRSSPEWGLSDLARAAGHDKATALRLLQALARHRMIEQDADTRRYRLGTAFLHLANVREESFPLASVIKTHLDVLARETNETAHASLGGKHALTNIAISEPSRSTRVTVDPSEPVPFHATASGSVYLAFGPAELLQQVLASTGLPRFTKRTVTDPASIAKDVADARRNGFAVARQTFEDDTVGIAVPFFASNGFARGAIAVVVPSLRLGEESEVHIKTCLFAAALSASEALGAAVPEDFRAIAGKCGQRDR